MKTNFCVAIALVVGFNCLCLTSCTEEEKSVARVAHQKVDDALVEQVGRAEVALDMLHRELQAKKENWAKIKTLALTYERRAKEARDEEKKYAEQGKPQIAALHARKAERYEANVEKMKERESTVETRFKQFQAEYEERKVTLQILKDEIASLKSMGDLADDLNITSESEERLEKARELEEQLKMDCDRASAIIDINMQDF